MIHTNKTLPQRGFTIVELLVIIVVIGILAGISVVSYGMWRERAARTEVQNDLAQVSAAMKNKLNFDGEYPVEVPSDVYVPSNNVSMSYFDGNETSYCIDAVSLASPEITYYITGSESSASVPKEGNCADSYDDGEPEAPEPPQAPPAPSPAPSVSYTGGTKIVKIGGFDYYQYAVTGANSLCSEGDLQWKFVYSTNTTPQWSSTSWQVSNTRTISVPVDGYTTSKYFFAKPRCVAGSQATEYPSHAIVSNGAGT